LFLNKSEKMNISGERGGNRTHDNFSLRTHLKSFDINNTSVSLYYL
jgi:hypothetical protein